MNLWQRPKTTRMYLHPPKSERIYTLWREGRVLFGEIQQPIREYDRQISSGIWFTDGDGRSFDYQKAEYVIDVDGIPTHKVKYRHGDLLLTVEGVATPERASVCYVRLTVENTTDTDVTDRIGFILRTGEENLLINRLGCDLYISYRADTDVWRGMSSTWKTCHGGYCDGDRILMQSGNIPFVFDDVKGVSIADLTLSAGECRETVFAYNLGQIPSENYEKARLRTVNFWRGELSRITMLPPAIRSDEESFRMVKNLVVQLLQCFCFPVGENYLLSRQGGLQRQIWTFESMSVLEALSRIGDFDSYIEPVIDAYFNEFYTESGEIVPFGIPWAMITGNVLYSFSRYAIKRDIAYFERYRDRAYLSFEWMKRTRASTVPSETVARGLFPPKSSCDDPLVFQSWLNTDTFNLRGLRAFAELLEYFGDEGAKTVRTEYEDYLEAMRGLWKNISDSTDSDEISVPFSPKVKNELIEPKFAFGPMVGYLVDALDMPEYDLNRVINYYSRRGVIRGGLYNRMPHKAITGATKYNLDENGKCTVYYVCTHEYYWMQYFLRHGMIDRCREIVADNQSYAMTDEYYMQERYNCRDPWFAPWSPNASANGRMINMILDIAERESTKK